MRLEKMDKLFSKVKILFDCRNKDQSFLNRNGSQLLPGVDVNQEVDRIDREEGSIEADQSDHHDEDPAPVEALGLTSHLRKLSLNPHEQIFFGKSRYLSCCFTTFLLLNRRFIFTFSGYQLVQTAIDLKQEYTGDTSVTIAKLRTSQRSEFWEIPQVRFFAFFFFLPPFPSLHIEVNVQLIKTTHSGRLRKILSLKSSIANMSIQMLI